MNIDIKLLSLKGIVYEYQPIQVACTDPKRREQRIRSSHVKMGDGNVKLCKESGAAIFGRNVGNV